MDLRISVLFHYENGDEFENAIVRKTISNTSLIPIVGMEIEDSAWKEPKIIASVIMTPKENSYSIGVNWIEKFTRKDEFDKYIKMYHSHGWTDLD
jgi:hypothetical protein